MKHALRLAITTAVLFPAADVVAQSPDKPAASDEVAPHATVIHDDAEADRELHPGAFRLDLSYMGMFQDEAVTGDRPIDQAAPVADKTGTDPRDFSNKFMPYYRYSENKNNVYINQFVVFGMLAFNTRLALAYEWPMAKRINYGSQLAGSGVPGGSNPDLPSNGIPPGALEADGDSVGMGDLILRFFSRPESLEWKYKEGEPDSISLLPTLEFILPTATEPVLGAESLILGPAITIVADIPGDPPFGLGFIASMNFYEWSVFKDNSRGSTSRYLGRHFWMQPLSKPGPGIFDGIYMLTELQTIYDFRTSDFDVWIGPEFGKIIKEGLIVYAKPGWGIDAEANDRKFTFEVGVRIFY